MLRQPIMVFMGNVDAGKTQLLDQIRNTAIVSKESGGITQAIGASIIPLNTIKKICGDLLSKSLELTIPGLLTIDTPGHAAFTNIRKRGGNLADIAVLVIDINEGVKPQTEECIEILKQYKTPFVISMNKVDLISGWKSDKGLLIENIGKQSQKVVGEFEKKFYEVVGKLSELGLNVERFDRVEDYTKQIAVVPSSATTGEGVPELLMVVMGLSQKFLQDKLELDMESGAKGTIIEVKIERGLGVTLNAVIYDGCLKHGDTIVLGAVGEPIVTKVKALFEPVALAEMRDKKAKFSKVKSVNAAIGVKISANDIDNAIAGMPLRSCSVKEVDSVVKDVKKEVEEVIIDTDKDGIVVKADSLGSLEAVVKLLKENEVNVKRASIGEITKKDLVDAESNIEKNPLQACVLGFNVNGDVKSDKVKVISSDIIYKLIDDLKEWQDKVRKSIEAKELDTLVKPCKAEVMKGYVFRQNNPAIVGCDVLFGVLKIGMPLMKKDGVKITEVKGMQHNKENVSEAEKGKQVATSLPGVTVGRQINGGDILYSAVPEADFKKLKKFKKYLSEEDKEILREIAVIMRKDNPVWGV